MKLYVGKKYRITGAGPELVNPDFTLPGMFLKLKKDTVITYLGKELKLKDGTYCDTFMDDKGNKGILFPVNSNGDFDTNFLEPLG